MKYKTINLLNKSVIQMQDIFNIETIDQFCRISNIPMQHPLVAMPDLSKTSNRKRSKFTFGFYAIYLKEVKNGDIKYGCNFYDYQDGALLFVSPGDIIEAETNDMAHKPMGHALLFHPDLIRGTLLERNIGNYGFLSYQPSEALNLSEDEREIIEDCYAKIKYELDRPIDNHSKSLIVNNIELFLNYCVRFYERQFITRETASKGILERFEKLLHEYYLSDKPYSNGLPSVSYFAEELRLSANYFGELIKKESGKTAKEYLQLKIMDLAKEKIYQKNKTFSEIAYELGFKYPQHFSRSFKQSVGCTPNQYKGSE